MKQKPLHMRLKNNKLQGFTLTEVMLVLCISAIVISMAYAVFGIIQQQMDTYRKRQNQWYALSLFSKQINRDVEKAKVMQVGQYGILLPQTNKEIEYTFKSSYILRTIGRSCDTFYFKNASYELKWDEERIQETGKPANVLEIKIPMAELPFEIKVCKTYLPEFYMNGQ